MLIATFLELLIIYLYLFYIIQNIGQLIILNIK